MRNMEDRPTYSELKSLPGARYHPLSSELMGLETPLRCGAMTPGG